MTAEKGANIILAKTPAETDYLFGFNDLCPWDSTDQALAVLAVPGDIERLPNGAEPAELCVWTGDESTPRPIAITRAWNYQQGARQRWLNDGTVMYNDLHDGSPVAVRVTRAGGLVRRYGRAIHALSPDEVIGVGPDYRRNAHLYPWYAYPADLSQPVAPRAQDDGVWALDMATGDERLLISIAELAALAELPEHMPQFVTHFWFNPAGTRFLFVHGAVTAENSIYGRLMVCDRDGGRLTCLARELVSHPCWLNDDTVAVWTRSSGAIGALRRHPLLRTAPVRWAARLARRWQGSVRNSLLSEGLAVIPVDVPGARRLVAPRVVTENGHWSRHPAQPILVGDTYPDAQRRLYLYLLDPATGRRVDLASFPHGVRWQHPGLRSDLHPRWDRAGTRIAVDISEDGVRRVAIVDARAGVAAFS